MADKITTEFNAWWAREGDKIKSKAYTARQLAELSFRQGYQHGFDAACQPENRIANVITNPKAARAI